METTNKFDAMGKAEPRAACKEHGVKNYGKMDNAGMRAALVAATQSAVEQAAPVAETEVAATEPAPAPASNVLGSMFARMIDPSIPVPAPAIGNSYKVVDGKRVDPNAKVEKEERTPREPKVEVPAPVLPRVSCKGRTVQKERETRNGVTRRSAGTLCDKIWTYFDTHTETRANMLQEVADANGWDRTTVHVQFYAWRKFMGIKGRAAK